MARLLNAAARLTGAALLAATLAACSAPAQAPVSKDDPASAREGVPPVPPNAIAIGEDLYMVPAGIDADGCAMFQPFSQRRMVVQAIHYRTEDGRFVIDKDEADCP